jgi:hypothetical protein
LFDDVPLTAADADPRVALGEPGPGGLPGPALPAGPSGIAGNPGLTGLSGKKVAFFAVP